MSKPDPGSWPQDVAPFEETTSKMLYSEEHFVVLEPGAEEQLLTAAEMTLKLADWIETYPEALPVDVQQESTLEAQIKLLLDESCSLEIDQGKTVQWFAVRLEK
ncbi:MAG: chlororespiratory reduction protein 7 [Synechococcales cyanobacterium CRU_2_2]|nr:chlororespiratory reduction protein 7 [Synechococcales cyanobacterium CRU_2_2]